MAVANFEAALEERADQLVGEDDNLLTALLRLRQQQGLSVEVVAERMGVSPETVRELERYDADPNLSTLRRYALSIGAAVSHSVVELPSLESPAN